jgi:hypothetical protein
LSNAGTWFIGRLQTERDKNRLLDGLEGAAAGSGGKFDRAAMEQTLAGLGNRVFLMNNVHEDAPVVFESRWALSYLRGPLTRQQIKTLMDPVKGQASPAAAATAGGSTAAAGASAAAVVPPPASVAPAAPRPVLPPEIVQRFVPLRSNPTAGAKLVYQPALLGCAKVYFADAKSGANEEQSLCLLAALTDQLVAADWTTAEESDIDPADLETEPQAGAGFAPLPSAASKAKNYDAWKKQFADSLYRGRSVELFRCAELKISSNPGESERDFRVRLQQASRENRDAAKEELRQRFAPKLATLQERRRRAEQAVAREQEQASASKWNTAISVGTTILGAFLGRKAISAGTIGKATTAARGASRTYKESQDVARAGETVQAIDQQLADLQAQFDAEVNAAQAAYDPGTMPLDTVSLKPKKTDINVSAFVLAWTPWWQAADGNATRAF